MENNLNFFKRYLKKSFKKQILYLLIIPYKFFLSILFFIFKKYQLYKLTRFNNLYAIKLVPFGRFGNNIQQLIIAVIIRQLYGIRIFLDEDFESMLKSNEFDIFQINFLLNNNINNKNTIFIKKVFFFFNEVPTLFTRNYTRSRINLSPFMILRNDTFLNEKKIFQNIEKSINKLSPPINKVLESNYDQKLSDSYINNEVCFLHLRSGDINNHHLDHFVTNPLSYYLWLRKYFEKLIIITEPGKDHILLKEIMNIFNVIYVKRSNQFIQDFSCIAQCKNLATSGVSTFPIAAALFNKNLKKIFFSNIFLKEHLNPNFLNNKVKKYVYDGNDYWRKWFKTDIDKRKNLILES